MNQSAHGIGADHAGCPEYDEDNGYSPQHINFLFGFDSKSEPVQLGASESRLVSVRHRAFQLPRLCACATIIEYELIGC